MKRFLPLILLLALPLPALAAERIIEYRTDVVVSTDSSLWVTERIQYDFGPDQRHGIFRDISKQSPDGPRIVITGVQAWRDGVLEQTELSNEGELLSIRIGNPDVTISGQHEYRISYTVFNEVRYFDDRDELYWNAIPNGFPVPIDAAYATLTFPSDARLVGQPYCYTGPSGSTQQDCLAGGTSTYQVEATAERPLEAFEGMTIAAAVAPGTIVRAELISDSGDFPLAAIILIGFVVVVAGILTVRYLSRRGLPRQRADGGNIIVQYDPPVGISAPAAAYLGNPGSPAKMFTAAVVQLAIDGWLKMEFSHVQHWYGKRQEITFYRLLETHPEDPALHQVIDALFIAGSPVKLSELRRTARAGALPVVAIAAAMAPLALRRGWKERYGWFGMLTRTTADGQAVLEHLAGLELYLGAAEKRRLEFHNAPERSPQTFEKLLPYAIALGVDAPWMKAFGDLQYEPQWATGDVSFVGMAGIHSVMNDLNSGVTGLIGAYASGTSGGGGGSSGGGGGGGGGGSW